MPATQFKCPCGKNVDIVQCLNHCVLKQRCMFLPTLRAIAASLNRNVKGATVTELISGTRETYLKKTEDYAVDPTQRLFAVHGSAVHAVNEKHTGGNMLSEERLADGVTSGKFDLYGEIVDIHDKTLGDLKVTSSYKLMRALGYYKVDKFTGQYYKTGQKKGQPKTRKEWKTDGVHHVLDWAIQLNYYRILLEQAGFEVNNMFIQAMCRDYGVRIAAERNITSPVYLIKINKISDCWIKKYMETKAGWLEHFLERKELPPICRPKERWNNRKCLGYCEVADKCPHGLLLKAREVAREKKVS